MRVRALGQVGRAGHPERLQDPRPHHVEPRCAAEPGDDLAEQAVGDVRVVEGRAGVERRRRVVESAASSSNVPPGVRSHHGPGGLGVHAGGVREQVADRPVAVGDARAGARRAGR